MSIFGWIFEICDLCKDEDKVKPSRKKKKKRKIEKVVLLTSSSSGDSDTTTTSTSTMSSSFESSSYEDSSDESSSEEFVGKKKSKIFKVLKRERTELQRKQYTESSENSSSSSETDSSNGKEEILEKTSKKTKNTFSSNIVENLSIPKIDEGQYEEESSSESERLVSNGDEGKEEIKKYMVKKKSVDDFEKLRVIGVGYFSKVYLVQEKSSQKYYAMKIMKKSSIKRKRATTDVSNEQEILASLDHNFIIKLHFSFQDEFHLYLVMDFAIGGELLTHANEIDDTFGEERARFYISEILIGLKHLHELDIIYRDMKLENLLIDSKGHIKICDFGSAIRLRYKKEKFRKMIGSPEYVSPEMLKVTILGNKAEGYGKGIDFWSLGVVLYELVFGSNPFKKDNTEAMYEAILAEEIEFPDDREYSEEIKDLVRKLLNKDPSKRIGSEEIMSHPFFRDWDWEATKSQELIPPFIPETEHEGDVRYVDDELLEEDYQSSSEEEEGEENYSNSDHDNGEELFSGFEYVREEKI